MTKKILFSATPTEKRGVLLEDDKVVELVVERPDHYRLVGDIYRGRIDSILPGLQAAFVDIGIGKAAFLHASDVDPTLLLDKNHKLMERFAGREQSKRRRIPRIPIDKVLNKGQQILVQVLKEPIGTKGPKVTTQLSIAGRFLVLVPDTDSIGVSKQASDPKKRTKLKRLIRKIKPPGVGFIVRTIGLDVSEEDFVNEIHSLVDTWRKTQNEALRGEGPKRVHKEMGITTSVIRDLFSSEVGEVYVDQKDDFKEIQNYLQKVSPKMRDRVVFYKDNLPLFDKFDVEKDLERSLKRKVWLKSGGYVIFDRTEALVAIDVNTGRNVGKKNLEETLLQTNLEAAREIARQLRLRDIGGIIVVDFIDMQPLENRKKLESEMRRALQHDRTAFSSTGVSKFGLIEITRKRVRPELQELYTDACPTCNGLGWVFSPATITTRIDRRLRRTETSKGRRSLSVRVHPSVAAYLLRENKDMIRRMEREHGVSIKVVEDGTKDQDEYAFESEQ